MKTTIVGMVAALLLIGVNAWAADGDLIVNGKLGIGTTNPSQKLDVAGAISISTTSSETVLSPGLQQVGGDTVLWYGTNLRIKTGALGGPGDRVSIMNNGKVGILNANPGHLLTMESSGGGFYNEDYKRWEDGSSGRWKSSIKPITGALDKVLKLNGVSFKWKKRTDIFGTDGEQKYISSSWADDPNAKDDIGLIGEDVMKVLPEVVSVDQKDPNSAAGVAYSRIVPLLIEAIKEQQKTIEQLRVELDQLKTR